MSNPNGAYLQILGFNNKSVNFYLEKGFHVILWNYRGYGKSTGSPTIRLSQKDAESVYRYFSKKY